MNGIMQKLGVLATVMTATLTIAATTTVAATVTTKHYDFEVNGIYYNVINPTAKEVAVTYELYKSNEIIPASSSYKGEIEVPSSVSYNGVQYTVTSVEEYAFYDCEGLASVTLPGTVTNIEIGAFDSCPGLVSIETDVDNQYYSSDDGILYDKAKTTLIRCPEGKSGNIRLPDTVTSIETFAFFGCTELTSIEVDVDNYSYSSIDGVLYDKSQTRLISCPAGKSGVLTFPDTLTALSEDELVLCTKLMNIEVGEDNKTFSSVDGILYDKSQTTLIICPGGKSGDIKLPDSVTDISDAAFFGCAGLTSITLPNSLTSIGYEAFYGCSGLASITLPDSLTSIEDEAFFGCSSLTSITSSAVTPPDCSDSSFDFMDGQNCYVPAKSIAAYKQAEGWRNFTSIRTIKPNK